MKQYINILLATCLLSSAAAVSAAPVGSVADATLPANVVAAFKQCSGIELDADRVRTSSHDAAVAYSFLIPRAVPTHCDAATHRFYQVYQTSPARFLNYRFDATGTTVSFDVSLASNDSTDD